MAIGWMIKVDITGDGYKDSVRGYAVAIRNRDEAMAAAREASGERVVEVDGVDILTSSGCSAKHKARSYASPSA
jgi:hypothetical protein